jgi:DNA-binding CsgD family transcriptional regulator
MERDFGYGLVRQLFGPLLRSLSDAERTRLFAGPAGLAAPIFGLGGDELEVGAAESSLYGLFWLLVGLAESGPLVLAIDDAHWSDGASLRFVRYLGQRLDGLPILFALAARPNEPGVQTENLRELAADLEMPTLAPEPLSEAGTAAIVRERLGDATSDELEAACHEATGGNPFLIEELLEELAAEGGGALSPDRIATMGPERIAASVAERARRLDPLAPAAVNAAAVLGGAADLRALAALIDADGERMARIVDGLTAAWILAGAPGHPFVHPLVRAAVYEEIPAAGRASLHARAAAVLSEQGADAETAAAHLLLCRPGNDPRAVRTLEEAAARAAERGAPESAAVYLRRALEEQLTRPRRADLLRHLGSLEVVARDPAAIPHLQEAAALTADPREALEIVLDLADVLSIAGQWEASAELVDHGLARFEQADLPGLIELEAWRAAYRGHDPAWVAELDADLPRLRELVAGRTDEESTRLRFVLAAIGALRDFPRAEVIELVDPAAQDWSFRSRGRESSAVAAATCGLLLVDATEEAEAVASALKEDGRRRGSLLAMISGVGFTASLDSRRGRLSSAEADLNVLLELTEQNDLSLMALATMLHFSIDAIGERSGLRNVADLIETLELPPPFRRTQSGGMLFEARAAIRSMRGDRAGAVADLRAAGEIFEALSAGPRFTQWRSRLALALPDADREEALALAAEELELARGVDSPRALGVGRRAVGVLAGGEEGIDALRDSVAVLRGSPAPLELARSLAELGASLRRAGRRSEAREQLREALDLAQRCGAERLEQRVREELRIAGARPRRQAVSGAASLTPGERRVVTAAAGGATNREIAQDLFVSLRTVEMHLTNAYRKLDISSRSELAEAIEEQPAGDTGL